MDGTSRIVLHSVGYVYALTLDYDTQTLYWLDYNLNLLESSNVDGTNRLLLTSGGIINTPYSITFYDGKLYWTDISYNRILSTSVSSPSSISYVGGSYSYDPYGIKVVFRDRQADG